MNLDIEIINEIGIDLNEYDTLFREIAVCASDHLKIKEDIEFSVSIIDNQHIHEINKEYRHIDRPTDVITFALEDEESPFIEGMPRLLGDIFISYEKAVVQAEDYGHSVKRELCFLFTHGLLHLLGYDHMLEADEKVMNDLQETILNKMEILRK